MAEARCRRSAKTQVGHLIRAAEYVLYVEAGHRGGLANVRTPHEANGDAPPLWHDKE